MIKPTHPSRGIAAVVAAVFCFALSDVLGKHLMASHPVAPVQAVRYLVNVALLLAIFAPRQGRAVIVTQRHGLVILRALTLAAASLTMGLALQRMPVGETVAIIYLAPFLVLLLSGPILGERVPARAWAFVALAFLGVLMILRPGGGLDPWGVALALVNVVFGTVYHLMTRVLTRSEITLAMSMHVAIWGSVTFLILSAPHLQGFRPSMADLVLMAALGALATLGHLLFTTAYRQASPSLLAPINYLHLVFAAGLGWVVFGHLPDGWATAGMALVLLAGAAVAMTARRQQG